MSVLGMLHLATCPMCGRHVKGWAPSQPFRHARGDADCPDEGALRREDVAVWPDGTVVWQPAA